MKPRISRRMILKVLGAAALPAPLPLAGCSTSSSADTGGGGFLSDDERRGLNAFANYVIPPEGATPGGGDLGAATYVERLCTAFEVDPPAIFCDGPYSGRKPLPDGHGGETGPLPPGDFARFLPLDRVNEKAWRIRVYGSKNVDGGDLNDPIAPPVIGFRDLVKKALADARAFAKAPLETLPPDQLRDAFISLDTDVQSALVDLVTQAAFAAPEYGGNPNLAGWKLVSFEGDTMPLGFSPFDDSAGQYRELPASPVSSPGGADPAPLDDATRDILHQVVAFTGGKEFS
jgi:hypothetical protein